MIDSSSKILRKSLAETQPKYPKETTSNTCLILQYHRVALLCHDPLQLAVEPCKFERQMEYLRDNFNVIPMEEMKQHLETATPFREKTVVVTFDGGYADVLYSVKEVLERCEVFATVFCSSAKIIERGRFWWDLLDDYLIANRFQGQLEIEIDGRLLKWSLSTQLDRFRTYDDLYSILSDKIPSEQREIIDQITQTLRLQAEELDDHRTMNAQELKKLEQGGLITIGGHTHNYVKLSSLSKWQQIEEILKNKSVLEEVLGHNIEYFSYPFGSYNSCIAETTNILQDFGFGLACGDSYGMVTVAGATNCYELPRVKVGDWKPFTFHRFLERFFG